MPPHLNKSNIISIINNSIEYLKPRTPSKIIFDIISIDDNTEIKLNPLLFQWVIENLCKNSIDAMDGKGHITILVKNKVNGVIIDVTDTGKGMSKKEQKKAFKQGFTTKKYGWGFGLPLAKRIIEEYHSGKLYILKSNIGKGTTFRIELNN
jgi:signal transduction histidine kinase